MKMIVLIAIASALSAQPKFDVASVKPAAGVMTAPQILQNKISFRGMRLDSLIWMSKDFQPWQFSGRSEILDQRFDVEAVFDPKYAKNWREMLGDLLAERFSLKSHLVNQPTQMFVAAEDSKKSGMLSRYLASDSQQGSSSSRLVSDEEKTLSFTAIPIEQICSTLAAEVRGKLICSDLHGRYTMEFSLQRTPVLEERVTSLQSAFSRYGVKVDRREVVMPMIVVDSVSPLIPN